MIMGLDMGSDDYITKPFKVSVLMSRINALLRRAYDFGSAGTELHSNGIKVLLLQGQAYKNGELLDLTAAEYKLLCLFMQNPNVLLSKEQILQKLWDGDGNYVDSNTLTVYIRRLHSGCLLLAFLSAALIDRGSCISNRQIPERRYRRPHCL